MENAVTTPEKRDLNYFMERMRDRVTSYHNQFASAEVKERGEIHKPSFNQERIREAVSYRTRTEQQEN